MFSGSQPELLAEYNRFMNEKLYEACAWLSDEERKRDRGAYFRSVHSTLNHLVWADGVWLGRFTGDHYPSPPAGTDLFDDFDELRGARADLDEKILAFARSASVQWLAEPMTWTSGVYGFTQTQPRWVLVTHFFNHQTHHRGQVHTLLMQLGIDIGPTDLPVLSVLK